ncbi:hypothetical protein ScPMuIL_001235 [Solemya velum]
MALNVVVKNATNVPNLETFGKSDPYVTIEFQGLRKKTEVKKAELNPSWDESFDFDLKGIPVTPKDELQVTVKDWERIGRNRLLGTAKVPLRNLLSGGSQSTEVSVDLMDGNSRPLGSKVTLKMSYNPPAGTASGQTVGTTATDGGGTVVGGSSVLEEGEEEEAEDEIDAATGQPIPKKKRSKMGRRKVRGKLSNKPQDFQIRIKVLEARQLQGGNIQPVCKVTAYNQAKQTRVKKSTNSPFWNEAFFFNFKTSPADLFDELIEFKVLNARNLRSDAFIGSFKFDIGMVYEQPKHAFINKWLLLSDPDDSMAGAKGYLKISTMILGPGDEAQSMKTVMAQDESEDIESNLLRPAGVQLRPATFTLKLYRAEDIPRMDSAFMQGVKKIFGFGEEQKELVDPYFLFSFAGKEVCSKIMYCSDHPEFNQTLKMGLQFPSMCERIKILVKDWDRITEDDVVGTFYLPISLISSMGDIGFLPTFGPCFINFYGSTREYSDLPDEYDDLNLGKGEGVAYRGRALIELSTTLGELPDTAVEDMENDDVLRVQKFLRRRKYKLHAAFLNATMIDAIDAPVEFEVSIGNYGNKLDENTAPCASTTQPTNAVFDGCHYYFLPWGATKPCVVVDSHWEDISFRLEALNLLQTIVDTLEMNVEQVKNGLKARLPTPELAQLLIALLDQLVEDCGQPLPQPQPGYHVANDLDRSLYQYRRCELDTIKGMAVKLRESATDVNQALSEVDNFVQMLKNLATEPQNSMPDVVIWMISGEKRIAYFRIPANEILYSSNTNCIGRHCGKLQSIQLKFPGEKAKDKTEVPALLRVKLWLGLHKQEMEWHKMQTEGELAVFAESYENQVSMLGNWINKGPTMSRPKFSDSQGKVSLPKEKFEPPPGWRWDSEWYISPELSMLYDIDAGHQQFLEDVYENMSRIPGRPWGASSRPWTDVKGDPLLGKDEIVLAPGWKWDDDWAVDLNRAVDEEGFEYCVEQSIGGYGPVEKTYHLCRRRRWVRPRTLVEDAQRKVKKEKEVKAASEGWEYAPLFNMKFHAKERKMDLVRRRRWHRKMVADDPGTSCFFSMKGEEEEQEKEDYHAALTAPRMFLTFDGCFKYQMRAYIYQARDLLAADESGLSDPFARVSFLTQSRVTEKVRKSLCPTWDQTLIFEEMDIYGEPKNIESQPPDIYIELYDHDTFGAPEFLGRTKAQPMVKLDPTDARTPILQWYDIERHGEKGGEMLAAFEIFMMNGADLPFLPPKKGELFLVPNGIRPVMQRTGIEVLCWGVRNMKKFQLASVTSPCIEFECGGHIVQSQVIKSTKMNPNFEEPRLFFDVMLPKEELYMPPVNIRVRDHRQFGRKPTVGIHILKSLEKFRCDPMVKEEENTDIQGAIVGNGPGSEHVIDMPTEESIPKEPEQPDEEIDWWSKFYASIGDNKKCQKYIEKGYDKIKVYDTELEKSDDFQGFADFCDTFELNRGKDDEDEESNVVGEFKGTFRVYPLPPDPNEEIPSKQLDNLPPSVPEECVVRVYVVQAKDLQPNDPSGLADPYLEVKLGNKKLDSRDDYIPNTINPVFGRMFEITTQVPLYKDLIVRVKDYDMMSSDDTIGETIIDLENRALSRHRATCGLPMTYYTSGANEWRDSQTPKQILESFCQRNRLAGPMFYGNNSCKVGNRVHSLIDYEQVKPIDPAIGPAEQRLALHILNTFPLVKEHVECRPLYNPLQPNIEQGKLQMWVDVFPSTTGLPGKSFEISARKPKPYLLRAIIWNTVDVILDEESITGEKMSDIYVTGWISGIDEKQKTDVHYRSLDGEGNFNWRFVFPFEYMPAEQSMIVKKKEHFWSLDTTEQRLPANMMIQIWDNDMFSPDDFLGTLSLNLTSMPQPKKRAGSCNLNMLPDAITSGQHKMVSLFEQKHMRGFWPCYSDKDGERKLTGKVEMELELISAVDAEQRPAGKGREEPNMNPVLEQPKRPETSFLWFTSPWKTFRYIVWKNYKWYFIGFLIFILILLLIVLFVYSFPGEFSQWILGN